MRILAIAMTFGLTAHAEAQQLSAPPSPLTVFFDWGKPDVRSDDEAVLDRVFEAYRSLPRAHLRLAGHTDRSGGASVNRLAGLSRAQTVRAELEKRGIPRNAISVVSFGEDRPLVSTEDGVREVQNRRVVITFEE